jgi:hypothetical protein
MSNVALEKPSPAAQRRVVIRQISSLREQVEDLHDYLAVLEARARNKGKRQLTSDEVRKKLGI